MRVGRSSFMLLLAAACAGSAPAGLGDRGWGRLGATAKAPNAFESFRHFDALARAGNVADIAECYDDEGSSVLRDFARACAAADASLSKIEMAVTGRFGSAEAAEAIHAAGQRTLGDVAHVVEDRAKGTASVVWKDERDALTLVLVRGQWKISVSDMLKGLHDKQIAHYGRNIHDLADQLAQVAGRVEAGRTPDLEPLCAEISEMTRNTVGGWSRLLLEGN